MTENKNLFLIHGAWCTRHAFNYITKKVLDDTTVGHIHCFEYDCQKENMRDIVTRAKDRLTKISDNGLKTVVVGHSMGGLIALKLSQREYVYHTVTMASPLSGLKLNRILHSVLLWQAPILRDIMPDSSFIQKLQRKSFNRNPVTVMIANRGFNPMITEPSDGVVPIDSQRRWVPETATVQYVESNHTEILQSPEAIYTIENLLRK
jgi:esterase/lipase